MTQIAENDGELADKQRVLYYYKAWDSLITPEKAGLLMGVQKRVIEELCALGLISKAPESKNNPGRYFKLSEVMTNLESFSRYVKSYPSQELIEKGPWIDFAKADHVFNYKESFKAVTILLQIVEGNLTAYHPSEGKFQLKSLLFEPRDFQECVMQLRDRTMRLKREEVVEILGIKDATLAGWIKNRSILPTAMYKHDQYFDLVRVYDLRSKYVTQAEALRILAINISTLRNWIRAGLVPGVLTNDIDGEEGSARVFDKEQLMQWKGQYCTSSEAIQILGVTKPTLYRWIKAGKLKPLDTVNSNQYWFHKQAVVDLKKSL
ncbi:hypothetical protein KSD_30120 [Ktedonobacter sp. SOSP1-85]|nr:hypothetical protein KSD_30120 [Ktedonobacter sp. SOSP1-85]